MTQKLKKSETLEIRLPYPTKLAFMARCRDDGRSASEALRGYIEESLTPLPAPRRRWRIVAAGLIAAALGAAAVPSLASANVETGFDRLDADHDGRVTSVELQRLDADHDGAVSRLEFRR